MVAHICKSDTIWVVYISPIGNGSIRLLLLLTHCAQWSFTSNGVWHFTKLNGAHTLKNYFFPALEVSFLKKLTTVGSPPNFSKHIYQSWGIIEPKYSITLLSDSYLTNFSKHYIYHKTRDLSVYQASWIVRLWSLRFSHKRQLSVNAGWQHMGRVPHPNYVDPECCVATVCH